MSSSPEHRAATSAAVHAGFQPRLAIQGYAGSFHQAAVRHYFGADADIVACATFGELIRTASDPAHSTGGVMAIENSIAGSILPNYNLLNNSKLVITGEVYLHIEQNLLAWPGATLADVREVHSHPMALQQCSTFLGRHPWRLVESDDTALSARQVGEMRRPDVAAVASRLAAELYGLEVLAPAIQTMPRNYTRFLVLERADDARPVEGADKASVVFHTEHTRGSLARVLTRIAEHGINLGKLQSTAIPGSPFHYAFHADLEFQAEPQLRAALEAIRPVTEALTVHGIYRAGRFDDRL